MQAQLAHIASIGEMAEAFAFPDYARHHQIEVAAYYKAEHRGFVPGHALEDWLEAEAEFDRYVAAQKGN